MVSEGCFGCFFKIPNAQNYYKSKYFLQQIDFKAHTTILSTASRTKLTQTFLNDISKDTPEVQYAFPLYDGVSVVAFKCTIGDKVIHGVVKEKNEAKAEYDAAVARGEAAGLLEQLQEASDVFSTQIGSIPKDAKAVVEIEYVGELKHDAQLDGIRYMIPTSIAPRYGTLNPDSQAKLNSATGKIEIVVDVEVDESSHIEGISSPSHPISMVLGRTSVHKDAYKSSRASAVLSRVSTELGSDFVIVVNARGSGTPRALIERHPDFPGHRALMTTLVPKFNLPDTAPEIVFIVDRSGSMSGKISTLVQALKVFLKSLPLSAKFNICSFGSRFTHLFGKSQPYDERSLQHALSEVERFEANYGGTELLRPIKAVVENRLGSAPLEIMVLTDGEIWNQQAAFDYVNSVAENDVRLFSLGVGAGASTSLVEGLARAGNGFAQFVSDNEKMDKMLVRMLKAALSPHISDYRLEVNYGEIETPNHSDDEFEVVDTTTISDTASTLVDHPQPAPVSLFDPNFEETATNPPSGRFDHLPKIEPPAELQAPSKIVGLFPYNRMTAYLLLPDSTRVIKSVMLKGHYKSTPIELEIPVQNVGTGRTIHQLAAKKAMLETEEGRGWLSSATASKGTTLQSKYAADWDRVIEREAVRLGVKFQVAGKFCSFVAVEKDSTKDRQDKKLHPIEVQPPTPSDPVMFGAPMMCAMLGGPTGDIDRECHSMPVARSVKKKKNVSGVLKSMNPFSAQSAASNTNCRSSSLFGSSSGNTPAFGQPPPPPGGASNGFCPSGGLFGNAPMQASSSSAPYARQAALISPLPPAPMSAAPSFGGSPFGSAPSARKRGGSSTPSFGGFGSKSVTDTEDKLEQSPQTHVVPGGGRRGPLAAPKLRQPTPDTVDGKMRRLIELQHFNGSWSASDELFKLTEVWKADFDDANLKYEDESVKATILAIAWLEKEAYKDAEVWEMVADKAKRWLTEMHGVKDVDDVVRQAIAVFYP